MPELPEVETTRQGISPHVLNKRVKSIVVRQTQLRWPINPTLPELLTDQRLKTLDRRGKYLLFGFVRGTLLVHLGMSGSLRIAQTNEVPRKHDHVDILFGDHCLRYHDPRRFGAMVWVEGDPYQHSLLNKLGPEPLSDGFDGLYMFQRSRKRSKDIKNFIMDSHIVVGVGNIYANEALFHAGIRPTKAAGKISAKQYDGLAKEIKRVLQNSIKQGGTTLRDFVGGDGKPGYFAQTLFVYGRQGEDCKHCGHSLKEIRQAQRTTVYCTRCQR